MNRENPSRYRGKFWGDRKKSPYTKQESKHLICRVLIYLIADKKMINHTKAYTPNLYLQFFNLQNSKY